MTHGIGIGGAIASQVRRYRLAKNWSVKRLAEECKRLGAPQLTAPSLSNIERGQEEGAKRTRRRVLVEELAVLARALDVSPIELTFPIGQEATVEVLPGAIAYTWPAVKWWIGEQEFPGDEPRYEWAGSLGYFRDHDEMVRAVRGNRARGEPALADDWTDRLRDLRKNMRRAGVLPPALPADLADIGNEEEEADGGSDQAD